MAVYIGYHQRQISLVIYVFIIIALFGFHFLFVKHSNKLNPLKLAFIIAAILMFSYPFLSHDFFNYLFDAKILTYYGQNPYFFKPSDFPADPWLRFMHWTHRTYPYGPVFLILTLPFSYIAVGKLILNYIFFKLLFVFSYLCGVYFFSKLNRRWAVIFATHPLVIIEGLVNAHNDLIAVSLAIAGIYFLERKAGILSKIFMLLSGGIKYLTLPLLLLSKDNKWLNTVIFGGVMFAVFYVSLLGDIQPWYFLVVFAFLPYFEEFVHKLNIFMFGLLFSYFPFIRYGEWLKFANFQLKNIIILGFIGLTIIYLLGELFKKQIVLNKK